MPRFKLIVLGVAVLLTLSACGGTKQATPTAPPAPSASVGAGATFVDDCWTPEQLSEADGGFPQWSAPAQMVMDVNETYNAKVETNKGLVEIELLPQEAPLAANNFACLAANQFYDGTPIHRIVQGFVIQGGDPTGTGTGGPGYRFADEPVSLDYERGMVAMANAGADTNGSQFFVILEDWDKNRPKDYTIFGRVTAGMDVIDAIAQTPTTMGADGANSRPSEPITIDRVTIRGAGA